MQFLSLGFPVPEKLAHLVGWSRISLFGNNGTSSFCSLLAVTGIGSCLELRQFVWAAFRWPSMSRALGKCSELRYSLLQGIQLANGHMELPSCPLALIFTCSCKIGCTCLWFVVSQFKASRSIKDSSLVWLLFGGSGPFLHNLATSHIWSLMRLAVQQCHCKKLSAVTTSMTMLRWDAPNYQLSSPAFELS